MVVVDAVQRDAVAPRAVVVRRLLDPGVEQDPRTWVYVVHGCPPQPGRDRRPFPSRVPPPGVFRHQLDTAALEARRRENPIAARCPGHRRAASGRGRSVGRAGPCMRILDVTLLMSLHLRREARGDRPRRTSCAQASSDDRSSTPVAESAGLGRVLVRKMGPAKGAPWPGRFSTAAPRPASGIGARTACREIGKGPLFEECSAVPTEGPYMHGATPFNTPTRHLDASSRKPR
jgi:hypothetical protein